MVVGESVAEEGTRISELVSGEALEGGTSLPTAHCHHQPSSRYRKRCFVFGKPLHLSLGLFSRATSVRRALLEEHKEEIFALKDFWPERARRPEAAF